ncbi:MAG: hypothetical protein HC781_06760 [Leptolyngbyaceae cyanobacterium CSU_1_4]|nr:hypothetical protein [Leptolyngbyaceae cyanobacterium CSU_1_4]
MRIKLSRTISLILFFVSILLMIWIFTSRIQPTASQPALQPMPTLKPAVVSTLYSAVDERYRDRFSVDSRQVMSDGTLPNGKVQFNETDLFTVLQNTQAYFQAHSQDNPDVLRAGILGTQGVSVADVLDTLGFMISTLQEDIAGGQPIRLKNPQFLNENFRVIKWDAYDPENPRERLLRLTKYAVFEHSGSREQTAEFNVPLYQLKEGAESDRFYLKYTKQEVLSGIYEPGGAEFGRVEPLAYLTRAGFEDALLQGTISINFTDGTSNFFNVDRNNGIAYLPGVSADRQGRYWYFRAVDGIKGYGHQFESKISIKPGVTFAGDVLNLGLGKIVALAHSTAGRSQLQLGVVADTGGAFLPNLHQLDFLAGVFGDRNEFYAATQNLPEYAQAYVLIRKNQS